MCTSTSWRPRVLRLAFSACTSMRCIPPAPLDKHFPEMIPEGPTDHLCVRFQLRPRPLRRRRKRPFPRHDPRACKMTPPRSAATLQQAYISYVRARTWRARSAEVVRHIRYRACTLSPVKKDSLHWLHTGFDCTCGICTVLPAAVWRAGDHDWCLTITFGV